MNYTLSLIETILTTKFSIRFIGILNDQILIKIDLNTVCSTHALANAYLVVRSSYGTRLKSTNFMYTWANQNETNSNCINNVDTIVSKFNGGPSDSFCVKPNVFSLECTCWMWTVFLMLMIGYLIKNEELSDENSVESIDSLKWSFTNQAITFPRIQANTQRTKFWYKRCS